MSNPPAFRTETDYPAALEAQKRAFEEWKPGGFGKSIMFFPTFTDPKDVPSVPEGAIVVGDLQTEPGMFWVHNEAQTFWVRRCMADGTWWRLLGIVHGITEENAHEFTKIVAALDPVTGVEWTSVATKNDGWSPACQAEIIHSQFPTAIIKIFDEKNYSRK